MRQLYGARSRRSAVTFIPFRRYTVHILSVRQWMRCLIVRRRTKATAINRRHYFSPAPYYHYHYSAPDGVLWWACLWVSVFACPRSYLRNYTSDLHQFLCMLAMAVARFSSGGAVIRYVFPVLWMTSYSHIYIYIHTYTYIQIYIAPKSWERIWGAEAHKLRLLDVTARLRQRGSHTALGWVRMNTRCRQRALGTTSCSQGLL